MIDLQLKTRGIISTQVIAAMAKVPREKFIDSKNIKEAYNDGPIAIGSGQTISQPYMVAMMTEALCLKKGDKVLEIGTGSGYQAAVLSEIIKDIYSIERISPLAHKAQMVLKALGYGNVIIKVADGTLGWPEEAPFEGIIVTSGAPKVPEILLQQLSIGGRLIIPVGNRSHQRLMRITRTADDYTSEEMLSCVFVPLIGEYGWQEDEV